MRPKDRPFTSDLEQARAVLGREPQRPAGAVFGTSAWYALRAYFRDLGDGPTKLPSSGGSVIVAHDPSMPTEQAAYYYLESNLNEHLARL